MGITREVRSITIAVALAAGLAAGAVLTGSLTPVSAELGTGDRPVFVPITPCRIFDTRPGTDNVGSRSTPLGTAEAYTVQGRGTTGNCTIPADAVALTLNVTAVGATLQTNLRVYPTGAPLPLTSNLNPSPGSPPIPNAVTTDLSAAGQFDVYNFRGSVHALADVAGYFVHHNHDDRYYTEAEVDSKVAASTGPRYGRDLVRHRALDAGGGSASIAIGADGNAIIGHNNTLGQIVVSACWVPGCSQLGSVVLGPGANPSLAIRPNGNPIVAFRDFDSQGIRVASCSDDMCASGASFTTIDSIGPGPHGGFGLNNAITIGAGGDPIVVYDDSTGNTQLKVAACNVADCSSTTKRVLDPGDSVGYDPSITVGTDGNPIISYGTASAGLKVAVCTDPTCAGPPILRTLDPKPNVGRNSSITIGVNGNPIVSFRDEAADDLKVAACADSTCSSAAVRTVDAAGDVGLHTSITIGIDGNPIISYFDETNDNLKMAECADPVCASATLRVVDSGGDVGRSTSITLGINGHPVIAYRDASNNTLKTAYVSKTSWTPNAWDS